MLAIDLRAGERVHQRTIHVMIVYSTTAIDSPPPPIGKLNSREDTEDKKKLSPTTIINPKKDCRDAVRGDKHYLRIFADRKAQISP